MSTPYLFSRKEKTIGTYEHKGYQIKYRLPKLLETNKFDQEARGWIRELDAYREGKTAYEQEIGIPSYQEFRDQNPDIEEEALITKWTSHCKSIRAKNPAYTHKLRLTNEELEPVLLFFLSIITDVEGLEDEEGPFTWDSLSDEQKRDFLESVMGVYTLFIFYFHLKHRIMEIDLGAATSTKDDK